MRREAWACAYQGGPIPIEPTYHATEAEAQARADHLKQAGIRNPVIYPVNLED